MLKDTEAAKRAAIPVEKINGPVLLISAKDDRTWSSAEMAEEVAKRLQAHKRPVGHHSYEDAGHLIGVPNLPTGETLFQHPLSKRWSELAGTPEGTAFASWDSWAKLLAFLDVQLKLR